MVGIEQTEAKEGEDYFNWETTTINKVAVEEVRIGFGRHAIECEYIGKIIELPMHIAANCNLLKQGRCELLIMYERVHMLSMSALSLCVCACIYIYVYICMYVYVYSV